MFWIKDRQGNLINLAHAVRITVSQPDIGGAYEVIADVQSGQYIVFVGDRQECGKYRDNLLAALKERERKQNTDMDYP